MKKITLLTFVLLAGMLNAQVVNIPDAAFKELLLSAAPTNYIAKNSLDQYITIDINNDGEIQQSEALAISKLNIYEHPEIYSVEGIEAFTNLTLLSVRITSISSLDLESFTELEELYCDYNELQSLDVSALSNLKMLFCGSNEFTSLDLSGLANLEWLRCNQSEVLTLILQDNAALEWIDISESPVDTIDLSGIVALKELYLYSTNLNELDLTDCTALKILKCGGTQLQTLAIPDLLFLEEVHCGYNMDLTEIIVGNLPSLKIMDCAVTKISEIDLSTCPSLESFMPASTDYLQYVNLKNGPQITWIDTYWNDLDRFLCIDEGEEQFLPDYILNAGININSYCSFTPGGDYNTIAGTFYYDGDNNGCSTGDEVQGFASVHIDDGTDSGTVYSNNSSYAFYVGSGTFTITPDFINDWFTASPASATVNYSDVDSLVTIHDFCLVPNGIHPDLEIVIVPSGAQPGFDSGYTIVYRNKGNQAMSGDIVFSYDNNVLDYVSANPLETSSSTGSLTWSYANLQPFETREINVILNVNGPMETPAINIGDELGFLVSITPNANDETPSDNSFDLKQEVVGSFDPNDITCLEGDTVHPDMIGEYLHYNINFENTGDAAATFIVVKDIINEEQFDVSSLQMLNASHDVEVRVEDNKVEFFFDAIDLGPLEKGNVTFKIKTLNTLQVNDNVMQQAEIFFDYNWPIETNEANTVFAILSSGGFELDATVKVYPNPAVDLVTIEAATALQSVQLYDVAGRLLQTALVNDTQASIDIASRAAGMYFVKITTEKGGKVEKIIKR